MSAKRNHINAKLLYQCLEVVQATLSLPTLAFG
jgi:hypothetical protein